jgi:hypothetical protein
VIKLNSGLVSPPDHWEDVPLEHALHSTTGNHYHVVWHHAVSLQSMLQELLHQDDNFQLCSRFL